MPDWSTDTRDLVAATIAAHVDQIATIDTTQPTYSGCSCGEFRMPLPPRPVPTTWWLESFLPAFRLHRADAVLTALTEAGALLPADGSSRNDYGHVGDDGLMVSCGRSRSSNPTHVRTVIAWAADGPNDNWPVYYGPWREVPENV